MKEAYTPAEMMIVTASRALRGTRAVFVGVGLPNIACNLAQHSVAPLLELIYESGVYGARPLRQPLSIGDPALVSGALSAVSMFDLFGLYLQRGLVDVALLGGAQIDMYGNLNTTVIGSYKTPQVRLPGSGGACEIAANAQTVYIVMRLSPRSFVSRLDFYTSPGHVSPDGTPNRLRGGGPQLVITDRAIFSFDAPGKAMRLESLYPGTNIEEVRALVGWDLQTAPSVGEAPPPDHEELRIIREELDPYGLYR